MRTENEWRTLKTFLKEESLKVWDPRQLEMDFRGEVYLVRYVWRDRVRFDTVGPSDNPRVAMRSRDTPRAVFRAEEGLINAEIRDSTIRIRFTEKNTL